MRMWTSLAGAFFCLPQSHQARSPRRGDLHLPGRLPLIPRCSPSCRGAVRGGLPEHTGRNPRGSFSQLLHEASRGAETQRGCVSYIRMQSQWGNYGFPFLSIFDFFLLECSTLGTDYVLFALGS